MEPTSVKSPALRGRFFIISATWEALPGPQHYTIYTAPPTSLAWSCVIFFLHNPAHTWISLPLAPITPVQGSVRQASIAVPHLSPPPQKLSAALPPQSLYHITLSSSDTFLAQARLCIWQPRSSIIWSQPELPTKFLPASPNKLFTPAKLFCFLWSKHAFWHFK